MIAVDTNAIVASMVSSVSGHEAVAQFLSTAAAPLCTTPTNVGEVLRLLTHPKVFTVKLALAKAVDGFAAFCDHYQLRILDEDVEWWRELSQLSTSVSGLRGNEVFDARVALCLRSHNVKQILTRDSDFKKYDFLTTVSY